MQATFAFGEGAGASGGLAVDARGNVYVADYNHIRKIALAPQDSVEALAGAVQSLGLPPASVTRLSASLSTALAALARGNTSAAAGELTAFEHKVAAQSGKELSADQAQPKHIDATQGVALWWAPDTTFGAPRATTYVRLDVADGLRSPRDVAYANLYARLALHAFFRVLQHARHGLSLPWLDHRHRAQRQEPHE